MTLTKTREFDIIYDGMDEYSKKVIAQIKDPALKAKANIMLMEILAEDQKNPEAESSMGYKVMDKKALLESYMDFLSSEGKTEATIYDYKMVANRLLGYLEMSGLSIATMDKPDFYKYLSSRKNGGLKASSYSKEIVSLKVFFKFLKSYGYTNLDISKIKIQKKAPSIREVLSDCEVKRIEEYLNVRKERFLGENLRDKAVFYLGIDCGLRRSEMIKLDWEDIDLNQNRMKILNSKGGKSRVLYLTDRLKNVLIDYRKSVKIYNGSVVRGLPGRKKITKSALQAIIHEKIFKKLGIYKDKHRVSLHSLRHYFITRLLGNGENIYTMMKLAGHTKMNTTQGYCHGSEDELKEAAIRLEPVH